MTEWKCARDSDKHYISTYAKEHPLRLVYIDFFFRVRRVFQIKQKEFELTKTFSFSEDVSETVNAWYAWYYKPNTVPEADINMITGLIPARLNFFSEYIMNIENNDKKWKNWIQLEDVKNVENDVYEKPHIIGGRKFK